MVPEPFPDHLSLKCEFLVHLRELLVHLAEAPINHLTERCHTLGHDLQPMRLLLVEHMEAVDLPLEAADLPLETADLPMEAVQLPADEPHQLLILVRRHRNSLGERSQRSYAKRGGTGQGYSPEDAPRIYGTREWARGLPPQYAIRFSIESSAVASKPAIRSPARPSPYNVLGGRGPLLQLSSTAAAIAARS